MDNNIIPAELLLMLSR